MARTGPSSSGAACTASTSRPNAGSARKTGVAGDPAGAWNRLALALLTYFLVNITWVFFRAADFGGAARILAGMFGLAGGAPAVLPTIYMIKAGVIVAGIVVVQWLMRNVALEDVVARDTVVGDRARRPPRCCSR